MVSLRFFRKSFNRDHSLRPSWIGFPVQECHLVHDHCQIKFPCFDSVHGGLLFAIDFKRCFVPGLIKIGPAVLDKNLKCEMFKDRLTDGRQTRGYQKSSLEYMNDVTVNF